MLAMKKFLNYWIFLLIAMAIAVSCNKDEEEIPPVNEEPETGILKLSLALDIEELDARVKEVNTDNFIVKIYEVGESEPVMTFPVFSDMPDEVELETGTYYVEAQNIDPPEPAAFEQPWYYGISEEFNIDKEDLVEVIVDCTLANYKVAFVYSDAVRDNFTTWNATATRMVGGESLMWPGDFAEEGYFLLGDPFEPVQALSIEVHLEYEKEFEEGVITRDFYATIDPPSAATLYRVNIDAELQDGIISIGINVDDGFDIVDINPVSSVTFSGPGSVDEIEGGATIDEDPANPQQGFGRDLVKWYLSDVWLADHRTVLWGPAPDEIKGSMNGGDFDANETMDFDLGESDLAGGFMVFTGSTSFVRADNGLTQNVELRFELTVKDKVTQTARILNSPTQYGLPPSIGGLVELTGINDEVEVDFVILARSAGGSTWFNFLAYYDSAPTPPGPSPSEGGGNAHTSFTGGFYWSNQ